MRTIYLDYAAATPLSERVRSAMEKSYGDAYGNPSSMHHVGRHAHDVLEGYRARIAEALQVDTHEIIFTGSGTESANLALLGLARAHRRWGNHVIVSSVEHVAILAAAAQLETEGFSVTYLPVDMYGAISCEDLRKALTPQTILVSIMYANNEIGTIQPIADVVEICTTYRTDTHYPLVHTDACQAIGQLPVAPRLLGVDALTLNSAKIYGPQGVGLLYVKRGVLLQPLIVGGSQERGLRAGTENVSLIAGFAAALCEAVANTETYAAEMHALQDYFIAHVKHEIPNISFNGHPVRRLSNNVHITIPDIEGESLVLMLSEEGICCSTGSACSSLELEPSHVLTAIGQPHDRIHGSLRFTFGNGITKEDLRYTVTVLSNVVRVLRSITACTTSVYKNQHVPV